MSAEIDSVEAEFAQFKDDTEENFGAFSTRIDDSIATINSDIQTVQDNVDTNIDDIAANVILMILCCFDFECRPETSMTSRPICQLWSKYNPLIRLHLRPASLLRLRLLRENCLLQRATLRPKSGTNYCLLLILTPF